MTKAGLNLIKSFESFINKTYLDPCGVRTIGYGTTEIEDVKIIDGMEINEVAAEFILRVDLSHVEKQVRALLAVPQNAYQLDALISFQYNTGGLSQSTLLRMINGGQPIIEKYFTMWNKGMVKGKLIELAGLTRRRKAEYALYVGQGI